MPRPARSTLVAYAAIALVVTVLGLRWLDRDAQDALPGATQGAAANSSEPAGAGDRSRSAKVGGDVALERAPAARLVVHVVGAVRSPGVYRLSDGSRVADAVKRAGGVAPGADTAAINLAAKLTDGQQVILPRRQTGDASATAAAPGASAPAAGAPGAGAPADGAPGAAPPASEAGPVSLASATLEQLDTLDGVGPVTAKKILDWRAKSGGFASVEDLAEIPGIGPKKLASLRTQVVP